MISMRKIAAALAAAAFVLWLMPLGAFIKPSQQKTACGGKRAVHMCSMAPAAVPADRDRRPDGASMQSAPAPQPPPAGASAGSDAELAPPPALPASQPRFFPFAPLAPSAFSATFPIEYPPRRF